MPIAVQTYLQLAVGLLWTTVAYTDLTGPPQLVPTYQRRFSVARGDIIRLNCPVAASFPAPLFSWYKDSDAIHDGWVRHRSIDGTLKIKDLEPTDTGVYRCQATNGFGTTEAEFLLYVNDVPLNVTPTQTAPSANNSTGRLAAGMNRSIAGAADSAPTFVRPDQMHDTRQVALAVGGSTRLGCKAIGRPRPGVVWYKDGVLIRSDGPRDAGDGSSGDPMTLTLKSVTRWHNGQFTCVVYNSVGVANFTYSVQVIDQLTEPAFGDVVANDVAVLAGKTTELRCHVTGSRVPKIEWLKRVDARWPTGDNKTFSGDDRFVSVRGRRPTQQLMTSSEDGFFVSILVLANTTVRDAGLYVCCTVGSVGVLSVKSFRLVVVEEDLKIAAETRSTPTDADSRNHHAHPVVPSTVIATGAILMLLLLFVVVVTYVSGRRRRTLQRRPDQKLPAGRCGSALASPATVLRHQSSLSTVAGSCNADVVFQPSAVRPFACQNTVDVATAAASVPLLLQPYYFRQHLPPPQQQPTPAPTWIGAQTDGCSWTRSGSACGGDGLRDSGSVLAGELRQPPQTNAMLFYADF